MPGGLPTSLADQLTMAGLSADAARILDNAIPDLTEAQRARTDITGIVASTESSDLVLPDGDVKTLSFETVIDAPGSSSASMLIQNAVDSGRGEVQLGEPRSFKNSTLGGYLITDTVSVPWYVSILGRGAQSRITFNSSSSDVLFNLNYNGTTWPQPFPATNFTRLHNFAMNTPNGADAGKNITAFVAAGPVDVRNVHVGRLQSFIYQPENLYVDTVRVDRLMAFQSRGQDGSRYIVDLGWTGDCVEINQCHFYFSDNDTEANEADDIRPRAIRLRYKEAAKINNIIGGDILVDSCKQVEISDLHHEIGRVEIRDSSATLKNAVFWSRGDSLGELSTVPLIFTFNSGSAGKSTNAYIENVSYVYDGAFRGGYSLTKNNFSFGASYPNGRFVFKDLKRAIASALGEKRTPLYTGVTCEYPEFNNYSQYASVASEMNGRRWLISTDQAGLPSSSTGIDVASSGNISDGTWKGTSGTYFYRAVLLLDKVRMLGMAGSAEYSTTLTQNGSAPSIVLATEFQRQGVIRLYRGTTSNSYNRFVDIPLISGATLIDTADDVAGFVWQTRTAGTIDVINPINIIDYSLTPGEIGTTSDAYGQVVVRARSNSTLPTTGGWVRGDIIRVENGPSNPYQQFVGWRRLDNCPSNASTNVLGSNWAEMWEVIGQPSAAASAFQSASSSVNTVNKRRGAMYSDTTSGQILQAMGSSATSPWANASGTTVYTPV